MEVTMNLLDHCPDMLTVLEAAEILRADPATVDDFIQAGKSLLQKLPGKF